MTQIIDLFLVDLKSMRKCVFQFVVMMDIPMLSWNGSVNVSGNINLIQGLLEAARISVTKNAQVTQIKTVRL